MFRQQLEGNSASILCPPCAVDESGVATLYPRALESGVSAAWHEARTKDCFNQKRIAVLRGWVSSLLAWLRCLDAG